MKKIFLLFLYLNILNVAQSQMLTFQMVNPCGNDGDNEFVIFTTGASPATVQEIGLGSVNDAADASWNFFWSTDDTGANGVGIMQNGNPTVTSVGSSYGILDVTIPADLTLSDALITELNNATGETTFLGPDPTTGQIPTNASVVFFLGAGDADCFDLAATNLNFVNQVANQPFYAIFGTATGTGYFSNSSPRTQYITIGSFQTNVTYTPTSGQPGYLTPNGSYQVGGDCVPEGNLTMACLSLVDNPPVCQTETAGTDLWDVMIDFVGGADDTYTFSPAPDAGSDDPDALAMGTLNYTGLSEGTDLMVTVTSGSGNCNTSIAVTTPTCEAPVACNGIALEGFEVGGGTWDNFAQTNVNVNYPVTSGSDILDNVSGIGSGGDAIGPNEGSQFLGIQNLKSLAVNGDRTAAGGGSAVFQFTQNNLSPGDYILEFDYNAFEWDGPDDISYDVLVGGVSVEAGVSLDGASNLSTAGWETQTINFTVSATADVVLEISIIQDGDADWGGVDNVSLCQSPPSACSADNGTLSIMRQ